MATDSSWFRITGLAVIATLIKQTGDQIMTALEDIQAQIEQINVATNDIAADIKALKAQVDSSTSPADAEAKLQQVSDALAPLVARLENVAAETDSGDQPHPDNTLPEPE